MKKLLNARNVLLDASKLEHKFGVALPHWRDGVDECVSRLLSE